MSMWRRRDPDNLQPWETLTPQQMNASLRAASPLRLYRIDDGTIGIAEGPSVYQWENPARGPLRREDWSTLSSDTVELGDVVVIQRVDQQGYKAAWRGRVTHRDPDGGGITIATRSSNPPMWFHLGEVDDYKTVVHRRWDVMHGVTLPSVGPVTTDYAWTVDSTMVPAFATDDPELGQLVEAVEHPDNLLRGPGHAPRDLAERLEAGEGHHFRTLYCEEYAGMDEERRVVHIGRVVVTDFGTSSAALLGPLRDLSRVNPHETDIQYRQPDGTWTTLFS